MKRILLAMFAAVALLAACSSEPIGGPNRHDQDNVTPQPKPELDDEAILSGMEFVKNMGVGWNLGNTFDAHGDDETAWGNAYTTKKMIDMVKARGFNTLRIPVTWQFHLGGAPDYKIEQAWLDRIEEVVNYGLDNDMYVIINIHHDEEIITPNYANVEKSKTIVESIWRQAAEHFKKYNNKLIFEILNEMRIQGSSQEWNGGTPEERDCINQFHAVAVAAIRAVGGGNATRKIMLSPYAASVKNGAMEALEFPAGDENLIAAVHSYTPYDFCLKEVDGRSTWGTASDKAEIDNLISSIKKAFIDKGRPVVLGEWGSMNRVENHGTANDADRASHAAYYAGAAIKCGICPIVWDDGSGFMIYNRHQYKWYHEKVVDAIINAQK